MATKTETKNPFEILSKIDVSAYSEKKGMFTYLSWAWAVSELLSKYPSATWTVHKWGLDGCKQPYMQTDAGCFVEVTVTVDNIDRTQVHPVLDHKNNTIKQPNAFDINTAIMRCLTKAISLHGLGLYIYAGEDLPVDGTSPNLKETKKPVQKNGTITTGYNSNMKSGDVKSTASQQKYIMTLREDFMKKLGNEKAVDVLGQIEKSANLKSLNVVDMTKQQASDYINGMIQGLAKVD